MSASAARIHIRRSDSHSTERRAEERGEPAYLSKARPRSPGKRVSLPDYYARLLKRQPKSLSAKATLAFWEEERR